MPDFLSEAQLASANKKDAEAIKKLMLEVLKTDHAPPPIQRPEVESEDEEEAMRRNPHRQRRDRVGDLLQVSPNPPADDATARTAPPSTKHDIPISTIMDSADAQHNAVLKVPWYVRETSNRDHVFANYIEENVDRLVTEVPLRCKDFRLLPEQRLAIMAMISPMPVETFTRCEIPHEAMQEITARGCRKVPFDVKYTLPANVLPTFSIADHCTGSGKTVMAIMAALTLLTSKTHWDALKAGYKSLLQTRTQEPHSGLCKMGKLENARLARVALAFVPATTLTHWYNTALSAVFGICETHGRHVDVLVWKGNKDPHQSLQDAYESGKPVIWILPMESDSMHVVRKSSHICYAVRIFDELNMPMRSRYDQPESIALFSYITQATIDSLEKCTKGAPRAPLRLAFGTDFAPMSKAKYFMKYSGYKEVEECLTCFCKLRQFAAPEFLRRLVADAVQAFMPRGLAVHRISLRARTLQALATGSDMVKLSLPDLAAQILGDRVGNEVRKRVKEIFGAAEVAESEVILKELDAELEKMPMLTMQDNNAKQALLRLQSRMSDIFSGALPSCPVTLETIPRERVRILKCCTAVMDSESIPCCKNRCPLCRGQIVTVGEIKPVIKQDNEGSGSSSSPEEVAGEKRDAPDTKPKSKGKQPMKQAKLANMRGSPSLLLKQDDSDSDGDDTKVEPKPITGPRNENFTDDDKNSDDSDDDVAMHENAATVAFERRLDEISHNAPYTVDGIMQVLAAQVEFKPVSRVLLCFGFHATQRSIVNAIGDRIRREVAGVHVHDIDKLARDYIKMDDAKREFDDDVKHPYPVIFIINTTETSSSVQGLDLFRTDLTVVADHCALHTQRQAVGRSLRMQVPPKRAGKGYLFPAKRVVVAVISAT